MDAASHEGDHVCSAVTDRNCGGQSDRVTDQGDRKVTILVGLMSYTLLWKSFGTVWGDHNGKLIILPR